MLLLLLLQKISKFNKLRQPCSRLFLEELEEVDIFEVSQDTIVLLSKKISSDYQFREIFNHLTNFGERGRIINVMEFAIYDSLNSGQTRPRESNSGGNPCLRLRVTDEGSTRQMEGDPGKGYLLSWSLMDAIID